MKRTISVKASDLKPERHLLWSNDQDIGFGHHRLPVFHNSNRGNAHLIFIFQVEVGRTILCPVTSTPCCVSHSNPNRAKPTGEFGITSDNETIVQIVPFKHLWLRRW